MKRLNVESVGACENAGAMVAERSAAPARRDLSPRARRQHSVMTRLHCPCCDPRHDPSGGRDRNKWPREQHHLSTRGHRRTTTAAAPPPPPQAAATSPWPQRRLPSPPWTARRSSASRRHDCPSNVRAIFKVLSARRRCAKLWLVSQALCVPSGPCSAVECSLQVRGKKPGSCCGCG